MENMNEQILSTEAEEAFLNDDHDPKEKTPTARQDPMFRMLQNADKTSNNQPRARLEQTGGGNIPLLSEIAGDFFNADESGPAAEKQLAEFINNFWY